MRKKVFIALRMAGIAGKLVQAALAFIRENATKRISAKDVIAHLDCSRRHARERLTPA